MVNIGLEVWSIWDDYVNGPIDAAKRFATTYWDNWPRKVEHFVLSPMTENKPDSIRATFNVEDGTRTYGILHVPGKYRNEVGTYRIVTLE